MVALVVVLLIPWLEEPTRLRPAQGMSRLHLDAPWTIFYGLLVVVGLTNYLPTRFGLATGCLALAFVIEYFGLTRVEWRAERRATLWLWVTWSMALGVWVARWSAARAPAARSECERLWFAFRDFWGVVWALRVAERFNRSAEVARWPVRLTWFGFEPVVPNPHEMAPVCPPEADSALRSLIRRFAEPRQLEFASGAPVPASCGHADPR
jgi:hypothetical protein